MGRNDVTFELDVSHEDDVAVILVRGRLTIGREEEVDDLLVDLIDSGHRKFILDLRELEHIVSAGIGALIGFNERLTRSGGRAFLANVHPRVARIFNVMSLDTFFTIYPDVSDALRAFRQPTS